ncbi:uncharacterized protein N7469_005205 [Penicillium citrinum]|uniref:Uncharacterized protein n=1 Tax=Penicillium citrinum TaxID=5077 RepID=A0A9W9TQL2_PENCI|nr:uncharacterized protein N7469_005205 [Penicillium citrinum]KAJ5233439.1 hypothetical protein N7469_005205 [Penicillium citrinum]
MHFTKSIILLAAALTPAFAAEAVSSPAAVTQTLTLVPSGWTPPTSTPTPTPTSTATPTSTPLRSTSTPLSSSASFSRTPIASTPLVQSPETTGAAPAATSSVPASGASSRQIPGVMAIVAVAGMLVV